MKSPRDSEIVVLGLVRNVASVLTREVDSLLVALNSFKSIRFMIVESDSSDETCRVLGELQDSRPNFEFISLGNLLQAFPNRIDRLAYCRNELKTRAEKYRQSCDYFAVADLDGVNGSLSEEGILSCWQNDQWDAITANQQYGYYDIYALRHSLLSPNDCWHEYSKLRQRGLHPMKARRIAVSNRQVNIPKNYSFIEVESAFGGFAIYKQHAYFSSSYSSRNEDGKVVCEHVPFHLGMKKNGFRIFINPMMINSHGIEKKTISAKLKYLLHYTISFISPSFFLRRYGE